MAQPIQPGGYTGRSFALSRSGGARRTLALLFFLFSFAGWLWELLYVYAVTGQLVNRGFFHGPWLPVYGAGGVLLLLLLGRFRGEGGVLFLLSALVGGGVEYAASLLLEGLFHLRWWDYTGQPGSLEGRVCLWSLLAFGGLGWLLVRLAGPPLVRTLEGLPEAVAAPGCALLSLLFALDAAWSLLRPNTGAGISFPL